MHDDEFLRKLILGFFSRGQVVNYRKGEIIVHPGADSTSAYCIIGGFVKAYTITKYGDTNILLIYKPFELFPLPWLLTFKTSEAFYEAMTDVTVRRMSKSILLSSMRRNPLLAEAILQQTTAIFRVYVNRVRSLEYRTARERVISRLLSLADRFGKPYDGKLLIDVPITHKDIADSLNMTRETASREIEHLVQVGLISQQRHHLIINDISTMQKEVE